MHPADCRKAALPKKKEFSKELSLPRAVICVAEIWQEKNETQVRMGGPPDGIHSLSLPSELRCIRSTVLGQIQPILRFQRTSYDSPVKECSSVEVGRETAGRPLEATTGSVVVFDVFVSLYNDSSVTWSSKLGESPGKTQPKCS